MEAGTLRLLARNPAQHFLIVRNEETVTTYSHLIYWYRDISFHTAFEETTILSSRVRKFFRKHLVIFFLGLINFVFCATKPSHKLASTENKV